MVPESISTDGRKKKSLLSSPLLFVNGQIISKFQSVYHQHQGKTFLNFTVLLVICTTIIPFMTHSLKPSSLVQSVRDMKSYAPVLFGFAESCIRSTLPDTDENI